MDCWMWVRVLVLVVCCCCVEGAPTQSPTEETVCMKTFMKSWDPATFKSPTILTVVPQHTATFEPGQSTDTQLTVVMPTYDRDLCKFRLNCEQLAKNSNSLVRKVVVMWMSDSEFPQAMQAVKQTFTQVGIEFSVLKQSQLVDTQKKKLPGWLAQQVAKLRVSAFVDSNSYLVLDSKNIATRPFALPDFQSSGKTLLYVSNKLDAISEPHKTWYKRTHETLNTPWNGNLQVPSSITPAFLHTATVKQMLKDVTRETGLSIEEIVDKELATEFCLYNVYLIREQLVDKLYQRQQREDILRTMWFTANPEAGISAQEKTPALFFGVQRDWLQSAPAEQRPGLVARAKKLMGITSDMTWVDNSCFE